MKIGSVIVIFALVLYGVSLINLIIIMSKKKLKNVKYSLIIMVLFPLLIFLGVGVNTYNSEKSDLKIDTNQFLNIRKKEKSSTKKLINYINALSVYPLHYSNLIDYNDLISMPQNYMDNEANLIFKGIVLSINESYSNDYTLYLVAVDGLQDQLAFIEVAKDENQEEQEQIEENTLVEFYGIFQKIEHESSVQSQRNIPLFLSVKYTFIRSVE